MTDKRFIRDSEGKLINIAYIRSVQLVTKELSAGRFKEDTLIIIFQDYTSFTYTGQEAWKINAILEEMVIIP